jgi:transposase
LWALVEPLIPPEGAKPRGGRPPLPARAVFAQIVFRLRTGCPWKALPNGSTVHRRFTEWVKLGIFRETWVQLLREYDRKKGAALDWCSHDGAIVKAPKGGTSRVPIRPIAPKAAPSATY